MLGLLHLLLSGGILAHGTIKGNIEDIKNADTRRINGTNCYLDHNNVARDIRTHHPMGIDRDYATGDISIKDYKTGKVNNISQNQREIEYKRKQSNPPFGTTVSLWCREPDESKYNGGLHGDRYKDLNNGRIYVKRYINHAEYYVDIESLEIVRRVDEYWTTSKKHLAPNYEIQDASTIKEVKNELMGKDREHKIFILNGTETYFNRIIPENTTRVF